MGSAAYGGGNFDENQTKINNYFKAILIEMNKSLVAKDMVAFNNSVADFYGESKLLLDIFVKSRTYPWGNNCTKNNYDATILLCKFFNLNVGDALTAFLNEYFTNSGTTVSNTYQGSGLINSSQIINALYFETMTAVQPLNNWQPKPKVIPAFVVTAYVANAPIGLGIDAASVIKELVVSAANYSPRTNPNGNGNGNSNPNGNGNGNNNPDLPNNKTQAGFGAIWWLLVGGALIYGVKTFSQTTKITK